MSDDEPHRVEDTEPAGNVAVGETIVKRRIRKKRIQSITVSVGFDENQKEFELWDYLYDFETEHFQMEAVPDYENRIQHYKIKAETKTMRKFRAWLMKKEIKYKIDKII